MTLAELEPPLPRKERRVHRRALPLPEVKFVPAGNPSLPTFVSLMLMITTFMIVLTSISLHENTRMRTLLASVRETFSGTSGNAETGTAAATAALTKLLGEVATGFTAAIPMAVIEAPAGGGRLVLTVPLSAVLDTANGVATMDFENGMAAMADALGKRPADLDYEIELRVSDSAVGAAHAGAFATAAAKSGIGLSNLFVGTGQSGKDHLSILVRLDPPVVANAPEAP